MLKQRPQFPDAAETAGWRHVKQIGHPEPRSAIWVRISEERDTRFTKSRTAVSLIPGQSGVVDLRLPS